MASPNEVFSFITSNYPSEKISDSMIKVVVGWNDGRSQLVFAHIQPDAAAMEVASPFSTRDAMTAEQAINANESMFGLGVLGEWYALKHVVPIADLDASEMDVAFKLLAEVADELEKKLGLGDNL